MKKLSAEKCREQIAEWERMMSVSDIAVMLERHLEAYRIALPILERQEVMKVPAYYIVYHPNPDPHEYDDKEHSHCGSIHLARRLAGEIGGSICPVYIGEKLESQGRGEGEWIEWKGGDCPVPEGVKAEIKFRDGDCAELDTWLDILEWRHRGYGSDIIAYRIIPEHPANQNGEQ